MAVGLADEFVLLQVGLKLFDVEETVVRLFAKGVEAIHGGVVG
jgi:hypothetical protein